MKDGHAMLHKTIVSADLLHIHNGMLHSQIAAQMESLRLDPDHYEPYWRAVRGFDLYAAY